LPNN